MATASGGASAPVTRGDPEVKAPESGLAGSDDSALPSSTASAESIGDYLYREPFAFDFFQAVRILEKLEPGRKPIGRTGPPHSEVVRVRALLSLNFPPSTIYDLVGPSSTLPLPAMTVAFMGLTGPSGALPRHYTELLLKQEKEAKGPEKHALRDWLDLFNHRLISLFYRAWEKYRFYIPYERGEYDWKDPDPFTRSLFSLIGLGVAPLRNRLSVSVWEHSEYLDQRQERVLARLDDLSLLHYSGYLSHRPRSAAALAALLQDYFQLQAQVLEFTGQWLQLEAANQSRIGDGAANNALGVNLVAGDRVWDVQSKFRIRLGPLRYAKFTDLLPDRSPVRERKTFFLLVHLARLHVGPEFDFDVQLILSKEDIPTCQLAASPDYSPRLGWNTWVSSQPFQRDAEDAVFEGEEVRWLNARESMAGE